MFLVTIPHSGETIPELCPWLKLLPPTVLLRDVDRFVDKLYTPTLRKLGIPYVLTDWHRYAVDLNRDPVDVDQDSVLGSKNSSGLHSRGFHWVKTTFGEVLMTHPMPQQTHEKLVELIYTPFHQSIANEVSNSGGKDVWHLDLHSMPSLGTQEHRDPGETRADIVVSDSLGKSADKKFVDLVINSYVRSGFRVGYNWPYYGGKVTEKYGQPRSGHHTVQVELNRSLYMDETTKEQKAEHFLKTQTKLSIAIETIFNEVSKW